MIIFKQHELLELIKPYLPKNPVIVEAGAFQGTDTVRLAKAWPDASIHAFEPVPQLYDILLHTTSSYPHITCYQLALSDRTGSALFYVSEKPDKPGKPSQAGSLRAPKERVRHSPLIFPYTITVPTITLDRWAENYGIVQVDFAWLDMQGHELTALQSSPDIVATLKVLYLEVSFIESYQGQPLYMDIQQWLIKQGFKEVGRDFTDTSAWFFGNSLWIKK